MLKNRTGIPLASCAFTVAAKMIVAQTWKKPKVPNIEYWLQKTWHAMLMSKITANVHTWAGRENAWQFFVLRWMYFMEFWESTYRTDGLRRDLDILWGSNETLEMHIVVRSWRFEGGLIVVGEWKMEHNHGRHRRALMLSSLWYQFWSQLHPFFYIGKKFQMEVNGSFSPGIN